LVSEIGLGCEHLQGKEYPVVEATMEEAFRLGINLFDVFMSEPTVRSHVGRALEGRREQAVIQGHIGAIWEDGQYAVSRDLQACRESFADLLSRLGTTYIDVGMIHFVDTEDGFDSVFHGGLMDYARELKAQGVLKAIGLATHNVHMAKRAVETGLIDVLMFSVNPAFDLMPNDVTIEEMLENEGLSGTLQNQIDPERVALYGECERRGVAITVMKTYMAGLLLRPEQSPFGWALSPAQCIHYALTRPAVASALIGCVSQEEIQTAAAYEEATDAERDFSEVFQKTFTGGGTCVYCNHCLPCPAYIDVAQVNKYLDLAQIGAEIPATIRAHYHALEAKAEDCTDCGACEERCPFGVPVRQRMKEAERRFG